MQHAQNSCRALQHIVQVRILQIRQKRCTIRASKARASERKVKRKNTRAPCRIRREGITCRGVVPFAFRRRRDVLFFSFFLRKNETGQWPSRFFVFVGLNGRGSHLRAPFVRDPFTVVRRGRACPARSLAHCIPFIFCIVGRGLDPSGGVGDAAPYNNPQGFSLPQTSAAAWGQAALHPTLPHSVGRAFARNSFTPPRRGRACPARSLAIVSPLSFAS